MTLHEYIEIVAVWSLPIAVLSVVVKLIWTKKGIGVRSIQFLAVATFAPAVILLAMEHIIDGGTVSALIGAFVGYLFANIAEFDRRPANADKNDSQSQIRGQGA